VDARGIAVAERPAQKPALHQTTSL
jgi:hypothetical protein